MTASPAVHWTLREKPRSAGDLYVSCTRLVSYKEFKMDEKTVTTDAN
jgi:hypothetical protein